MFDTACLTSDWDALSRFAFKESLCEVMSEIAVVLESCISFNDFETFASQSDS